MTTSVLKLKFKLETISHETILYMPQILWSRPQSCDDFWAIISLINSLVFLGSTVELFISSALYCSIDFVDEQKRWCPCQRPWYYRNLCKFFFLCILSFLILLKDHPYITSAKELGGWGQNFFCWRSVLFMLM